jgi:radical SAM superfamily enzyme YgiQ (UPF0313 family)
MEMKEKKPSIVLLHPDNEKILGGANTDPPLGLACIAGVLKINGFDVRLEDFSIHSEKSIEERIGIADIYGLSLYTCAIPWAKEMIAICRKINPSCLVIAGGPEASAEPEKMIELGFDSSIKGEGEYVFLEIAEKVSSGESLESFKKKVLGPGLIANLDALPWEQIYELIDLEKYSRKVGDEKATSVMLSRGCPWDCYFCGSAGSTVRYISDDRAIEILKFLVSKGYRHFIFYDDTFIVRNNPKFKSTVKGFLERLAELKITFRANGRSNVLVKSVNEGNWLLPLLKKAGCVNLAFGIESGSQRLLDIYNKRQTVDDNMKAIIETEKAGIKSKAYVIVSPFDDDQSINETIEFMKKARPSQYTVFSFVAYPGTQFCKNFDYWNEKYGLSFIEGADFSDYANIFGTYSGGFVLQTKNCPVEKFKQLHKHLVAELEKEIGSYWKDDRQDYFKYMNGRK